MTTRIVTWDWRDQPPWGQINEALASLLDARYAAASDARIIEVPETGDDQYAVVVTDEPSTTPETAQVVWERFVHDPAADR
jgi:hypothetical protein